MGRTVPSIAITFMQQEASFSAFKKALRRSDQLALEELFAYAHRHLAEAAYASDVLPFQIFLLAMLLEEHRKVMRLRQAVEEKKDGNLDDEG